MIPKFPLGDRDWDFDIVARRNGAPKYGEFGTIVYLFRASLETPAEAGTLYHPVDSWEEALHWLEYYRDHTTYASGNKQKTYHAAYFEPTPSYVREA